MGVSCYKIFSFLFFSGTFFLAAQEPDSLERGPIRPDLPWVDTASHDVYRYKMLTTRPDGRIDTTEEVHVVPRKALIYTPKKVYHFRAVYLSPQKDTLSDRRVRLVPTGYRWPGATTRQVEIQYEYEVDSTDLQRFDPHPLNPTYHNWRSRVRVAATENEEEIWIRPMRHNQYIFTQVAPFPEVRLPLEKGKSWQSSLRIRNYGLWSGHEGTLSYMVTGKKKWMLPSGEKINCWKIESMSEFEFGNSRHTYYFDRELGFVRMEYENYAGESLLIELVEIEARPPLSSVSENEPE